MPKATLISFLIPRWLSAIPRIAGTEADLKQAKALKQIWKEQGLDNSGIEVYDVLLSYPGNDSFPNKVFLARSVVLY